MHRVVLFPVSLPEAQESAETVYPAVPAAFFAALAVITTLLVAPFKTADKTDQPLASAVAVKVDETEPGATVADAGADSTVVLLSVRATVTFQGTADTRVTAQVELAPTVNPVGLHVREESTAGMTRFRVEVAVLLPRVAVSTAVPLTVTVPAVAEKVAEVAPAATVTEAGVVSRVLLSEIETTAPPEGAA